MEEYQYCFSKFSFHKVVFLIEPIFEKLIHSNENRFLNLRKEVQTQRNVHFVEVLKSQRWRKPFNKKTVPKQTLKFFINDNHRQIQSLYSSIANLENVLRNNLSRELYDSLKEKVSKNYESTKITEKRRLINE